jgi:hypothetical protein
MSGTSPPFGTGTHYSDTSTIVTDVTDIIFQITPEDTPFFHLIGDVPANVQAPWHQWQMRDLVTRQVNVNFEGFSYTFTSGMRLPTRQGNVLQILNKDIRVSRTNQAIGHYAIPSMTADQTEVKLTELKTDIEHALLTATLNTGSTATARQMVGLIPMAQSNLSMYTNGSAATFSEVLFNGMLEQGWSNGAEVRDILVDGRIKRVITNFTGNAARVIAADQQRLVNTIGHYDSDYGPINIHLSRDLPTFGGGGSLGRVIVGIDKTHANKAWLRPVTVRQTADIADSDDAIAVTELTLEWGNPNSHFVMLSYQAGF